MIRSGTIMRMKKAVGWHERIRHRQENESAQEHRS